jgi:hypothetical protein
MLRRIESCRLQVCHGLSSELTGSIVVKHQFLHARLYSGLPHQIKWDGHWQGWKPIKRSWHWLSGLCQPGTPLVFVQSMAWYEVCLTPPWSKHFSGRLYARCEVGDAGDTNVTWRRTVIWYDSCTREITHRDKSRAAQGCANHGVAVIIPVKLHRRVLAESYCREADWLNYFGDPKEREKSQAGPQALERWKFVACRQKAVHKSFIDWVSGTCDSLLLLTVHNDRKPSEIIRGLWRFARVY